MTEPDLTEVQEILARTPAVLRSLLAGLPAVWRECDEGPGTFRPADVVGHLLHGERTDWIVRVEHILEHGDSLPFEPFDRRGHEEEVARRSLDELLDAFRRERARSLTRLEGLGLSPADLARRGLHPALGPVTLGQLLATWVVHDLGHLRQVCRVLSGRYRDRVGPWQAYLPVLAEGPAQSRTAPPARPAEPEDAPAAESEVLAIDLGATFTKVVHRPRASGEVWTSARLALDDGWEGEGLVPTAFARRRADGEPAFGYRALGLDPATWESYPDWKRRLFVDGEEAALASLRPLLTGYLRWLGVAAARSTGCAHPTVVLAVPLLEGEHARRGRDLLREAARAAFPDAPRVLLADEPSAAFRGATTGNLNARALGRMLVKDPGGLWHALHDAAVGRRPEPAYRALVADLGSLTLDLCLLRFDVGAEEPQDRFVPHVEYAASVLLGVEAGLDVVVHAAMARHAGAAPPPRRSEAWTRIRNRLLDDLSDAERRSRGIERQRELFRGTGVPESWIATSLFSHAAEPWPEPVRVGDAAFGTRAHWDVVGKDTEAHAERVADAIRAVGARPDYVLFTGGGFRAARLLQEVERRLDPSDGCCVRHVDEIERIWGEERRGLDLARFGTAYGAANVLVRPYP